MPAVFPITDLQRNMKEVGGIIDEHHEPVYLTRNGRAKYVLVDAQEYDEVMALHELVREREERVNKSIQRGMRDFERGAETPLDEAIARARAMRESDEL